MAPASYSQTWTIYPIAIYHYPTFKQVPTMPYTASLNENPSAMVWDQDFSFLGPHNPIPCPPLSINWVAMPMDVSFSVKKKFLEDRRLSKKQLQDRGVFQMIRILLWEGYCGKNGFIVGFMLQRIRRMPMNSWGNMWIPLILIMNDFLCNNIY